MQKDIQLRVTSNSVQKLLSLIAKCVCGIRSHDNSYHWKNGKRAVTGREHKGALWGADNILFYLT